MTAEHQISEKIETLQGKIEEHSDKMVVATEVGLLASVVGLSLGIGPLAGVVFLPFAIDQAIKMDRVQFESDSTKSRLLEL